MENTTCQASTPAWHIALERLVGNHRAVLAMSKPGISKMESRAIEQRASAICATMVRIWAGRP